MPTRLLSLAAQTALIQILCGHHNGEKIIGMNISLHAGVSDFFNALNIEVANQPSVNKKIRATIERLNTNSAEQNSLLRVIEEVADPRHYRWSGTHAETLEFLNQSLKPDGLVLVAEGEKYRLSKITPPSPVPDAAPARVQEARPLAPKATTTKEEVKPEQGPGAPKVFISYSWDDDSHKKWVKDLATRLRQDHVDVTLDQWKLVHGDRLTEFMETAIRSNGHILIVCTPAYKKKSDERTSGVGYEGDVMTAEVLTTQNHRKFIPVLRSGRRSESMPSWLSGKLDVDLCGNPYSESNYQDLLATLHNRRETAPPLGGPPPLPPTQLPSPQPPVVQKLPPIRIEGVMVDEVGIPRNDGTAGSALYPVPFKLNRQPPGDWVHLFLQAWESPPRWTSMHRPKIAKVVGDRIILSGTTMEEVRDVHRDTLNLCVDVANKRAESAAEERRNAEERKRQMEAEHKDRIRKIAGEVKFD